MLTEWEQQQLAEIEDGLRADAEPNRRRWILPAGTGVGLVAIGVMWPWGDVLLLAGWIVVMIAAASLITPGRSTR